MDNMIISGVRIYFPLPGERLPFPSSDIRSFAIKSTTGSHSCLLEFQRGEWLVLPLPEFETSGKAIMAAVRLGKNSGHDDA
jgi:hypothetical protein